MSHKPWLGLPVLIAAVSVHARADLKSYVEKPEPQFAWKLEQTRRLDNVRVHHLRLTSQVWKDTTWTHDVTVYWPDPVSFADTALLLITGGSVSDGELVREALFAQSLSAPFVHLHGVPNQPLLGGKSEDALIAETFERYLKTHDDDWPLLFPMAKSVIKGMDAVQAFAKQELRQEINGFVLTGASKRGWTTWLTATVDPRVRAIAPMVYDNLNLNAQMEHQIATWGQYSSRIRDYTELGLQEALRTPWGQRLAAMVDPYTQRRRLTMPKLILNGTNDPYWPADATEIYWYGLPNPKWVLYVPNAGHGVLQDRRAVEAIVALHHQVAGRGKLPTVEFIHGQTAGKLTLRMTCKPAPDKVLLWKARSSSRDFRQALWIDEPLAVKGQTATAAVALPERGFTAFFAEAVFSENRVRPLSLCTTLRITPEVKPASRPASRPAR